MKKASYDPDAQLFIDAAVIENLTQQLAINQLVIDFKTYGIWTKFKAIYPIVGGTAAKHKWNLKDPRDLDAAFRLTFANAVTHSSTGMKSNGSSGYADTFIRPAINLINDSCHISFYSRTNISNNNWDMGVADDATSYIAMNIQTVTNLFRPFAQDISVTTASNTNSIGFYIANRTNTNAKSGFKNNTKVVTSTAASGFRANNKIFLLAVNYFNQPNYYSTRECAFASIGDGLTDIDASNLYTAVQAFQTTLGRQV